MRRISMCVIVLMMTGAVMAQLPEPYATWAQGPAKHLMTKEDMKQWNAIKTEAEAKAFIDLFWARRDPTPSTPRNEFREEFDMRVAAADQNFTTAKTKGSMSDRGRALILLGSPYQVGGRGAERAAGSGNQGLSSDGGISVGAVRAEGAKLTWTYSNDKKPKFIQRRDFEILFSDERGGGEFEFARTPRVNPEQLLQEAVNAYLVSPNLTAVPTYASATPAAAPGAAIGAATAFKDAALKAAYDQFKTEQKASVGSAHVTWGEFVTPEGEGFVPVSVYVPASAGIEAGKKVTFFGVVEDANGRVVQVHEEEATLAASGKDAYYDKTLSLAPGKYTATFGLAANGSPLAINKTEVTVAGLNATEPGASDLILSNNAYPLPQAQRMTDPFAFGGLKVVPKGDAIFSTADDIWYFVELRNPGLGDTGAPKVQVKLDINGKAEKDGKPVKMNFPPQEVETIPLKGVKDHHGLAMSFPLKDFAPGTYTVKLKVIDTVLQKTYTYERPFQIKS